MRKARLDLIIPALVLAIALPAGLSWAWYRLTGDPTLRPLGVTLSSLRESEVPGFGAGLTVRIDWGAEARSPHSPAQVERILQKALRVYEMDYRIRMNRVPGAAIRVYFETGATRLGPFTLAEIAAGIPPAVAAYRMGGRPVSAPASR